MFETYRPFRLTFVNPMSVDNLPLFDVSLFHAVLNSEPGTVIRYYGNEDINQEIPDTADFIGVYRYRKHNCLVKGFSYLCSQLRLISELIRFQPDIIHMQWPKLPFADRFVWRFLKRKLRSSIFVHTSHNVLPHDSPAGAKRFWPPIYQMMDGINVHHQDSADILIHDFRVPRESVSVIPHGPLRFPVDRETLKN